MNYSAYLFDFDYTLVNSAEGIVKCYRIVLERHGYHRNSDEEIKQTIGKTLEESFEILTGENNAETLAQWRKEYTKEADLYMNINTHLFPGVLDVLKELKKRKAKIGIISTKYRRRITDFFLDKTNGTFFDIIIGGEDVAHPKPHPEGLLRAIEKLSINKSNVLYVGDSLVDSQTAQAAEVDFAGVTTGTTTADKLAAYPHKIIIKRLTDLL